VEFLLESGESLLPQENVLQPSKYTHTHKHTHTHSLSLSLSLYEGTSTKTCQHDVISGMMTCELEGTEVYRPNLLFSAEAVVAAWDMTVGGAGRRGLVGGPFHLCWANFKCYTSELLLQ
jgi:hypothetical protein